MARSRLEQVTEYHLTITYEARFINGNIKKDKDNQMLSYFQKTKGTTFTFLTVIPDCEWAYNGTKE